MDVWKYFYAIAVFQGLFVFLVLLKINKGNRKANTILASLILLLTFYLVDNLLGMTNFFMDNPHFIHITTPLWYLFPPLTFFYVKYLVNKKLKWDWIYILHFLPFLYILNQFVPFYFLPGEVKLQYYTGALKPPGGSSALIFQVLISPLQLIFYSSFILFKMLNKEPSQVLKTGHLNWLKIVFTLLLVFGTAQSVLITRWIIAGEITLQFKFVPLALFSFIIYSIAYLAIVQPETIFNFNVLKLNKLNGVNAKDYSERLLNLVENEKLYLNSDLKYSSIASRLGISARYLTEILNKEMGKGFSDFINEYRVEEVKRKIDNNDLENFTLYALALDSGFNSKSSFNRVFKKHTGYTPSEYVNISKSPQTQKVS